jgi:polyvinyl alcohol dehydrogenase (cytochrome)
MDNGHVRGRQPFVPIIAAAALLAAAAACSSGPASVSAPLHASTPSTPIPPARAGADWPAYHGNAARTGVAAGLPRAGRLSVAWSRPLRGAVYGQPLVIGQTVIAATEDDMVYGISRATGKIRWRRKVGTPLPLSRQPCGDLDPLGITGTPVYDPGNGLVYVVAQSGRTRHLLVGLRVSTGAVVVTRNVPVPDHQPAYDQQRGALALLGSTVYVPFGGHYGDCGPYIGSVVGMPASGTGKVVSYMVPTAKQGGIWASAGPVIDSSTRRIFVSVGNGAPGAKHFDGSDSVTELNPDLRRVGIFAPADWRTLSAGDLDLGSSSPVLLPRGRVFQVGKSPTGYLLNAARLGGVAGQLSQGKVCSAFGGAAVSGGTIYMPCYPGAMTAVRVTGKRITVLWHGPQGAWGSPVVGGGAVWVANWQSGTLYELAQRGGAVRHRISLGGALPHFVSPALSGTLVIVGTVHGVVAVSGA